MASGMTKSKTLSRKKLPQRAAQGENDPELEALVREIIGRVADKWTMLILEVLAEKGELRFTRLSELVDFRQADFRYQSALDERIGNNALVESAPRS